MFSNKINKPRKTFSTVLLLRNGNYYKLHVLGAVTVPPFLKRTNEKWNKIIKA